MRQRAAAPELAGRDHPESRCSLVQAGESYAMDQAAMARERRWTIAEEKLNGALMVSPNGAFRTRWDMIQVRPSVFAGGTRASCPMSITRGSKAAR